MPTMIMGTGHYLPDKVVTNDDLAKIMPTSDEWIQQRTGIRERRYVDFDKQPMGSSDLGARAAEAALKDAGVSKDEVDLIIHATLSADRQFPGDACIMQAKLDVPAGVPAMDIRNQCSGFLYGLSVANAFIRTGTHRRILLVGAETHSTGVEFTERGRDVAVLFGDGGGAVVLGPGEQQDRGVLSVHVHADGRFADDLHCPYPASCEQPRLSVEKLQAGYQYPKMNGKTVFKHAVKRMPEVICEALEPHGIAPKDLKLLIPHQANLRINEMVQKRLELRDDQVFNNIQKYGNTTAASIPIALDEARKAGRIESGDLICLASFGSGFTWGAALIRW